MAEPRVVTFTTDFGLQDPFVGIMHGVVLGIHAETRIVDICHAVPSFDVLDGALTVAQSYRYFPPRTVHVVVVDPGVGSERRPILAETNDYIFIAPDNGVLSLVEKREERFTVRTSANPMARPHPDVARLRRQSAVRTQPARGRPAQAQRTIQLSPSHSPSQP